MLFSSVQPTLPVHTADVSNLWTRSHSCFRGSHRSIACDCRRVLVFLFCILPLFKVCYSRSSSSFFLFKGILRNSESEYGLVWLGSVSVFVPLFFPLIHDLLDIFNLNLCQHLYLASFHASTYFSIAICHPGPVLVSIYSLSFVLF